MPLRAEGVDSLVIKELMGHESLATTAIYVDVPLNQLTGAVGLLPDLLIPRDQPAVDKPASLVLAKRQPH